MLHHYTSTVVVFQSTEYKNFTMIKGNRPLNEVKMNKIIKQIESGNDMLAYYPIQVRVVGGKMEILDGQHRFVICKKLKRPVHYIIVTENKSMSDIANINSNVEKWKGINFINCYIQDGNENYKLILKFNDTYQFSLGVTLMLLSTGNPGSGNGAIDTLSSKFQQGTFEVQKFDQAVEFAEICKQFSTFKNWRQRALLIAIYRIWQAGKIPIEDLIAAFNKNPAMLTEQANFKDYILCLEKIMNVGKKIRVIIS